VDERERSDDVDLKHASEEIERVFHERRERGSAEFGGVVEEEIQTTDAADGRDQITSVSVLRNVTGHGADGCAGRLKAFHGV